MVFLKWPREHWHESEISQVDMLLGWCPTTIKMGLYGVSISLHWHVWSFQTCVRFQKDLTFLKYKFIYNIHVYLYNVTVSISYPFSFSRSFSLVVPSPLSVYTDTHTLRTTSFLRIYFGFGLFKMGISTGWIAKGAIKDRINAKEQAFSHLLYGYRFVDIYGNDESFNPSGLTR